MTDPVRGTPVPASLRPWIEDVDVESVSAGDSPLIHLPDTAAAFVWRTTVDGRSDIHVMGPRTRAGYYAGKHVPLYVRIRVRTAWARPLLGVPVNDLVDRVVPVADLWGGAGRRLSEELTTVGADHVLAVKHIEAALLARLSTDRARDLSGLVPLHHAALDLSASPYRPPAHVQDAARRLGLSERRLRTTFAAAVGVTPKHFARISRVRSVLAGVGRKSLAELAIEAGYYDQSHMTAEFRTLMRVTPGRFADGRLPVGSAC